MLIKQFKCQICGYRFEVEVLDREDPREKDEPGCPVVCQKCGSPRLEQVWARRRAS